MMFSDNDSSRTLFIVRAVLGNVFVANQSETFTRPPCQKCSQIQCSHGKQCDSVLGKHMNTDYDRLQYREFIFYENGLCYPMYCVTYTVQ